MVRCPGWVGRLSGLFCGLLVCASAAQAAHPVHAAAANGQLPTTTIGGYRTYGPVEPWSGYPIPTDSSLWVVNPTGCLWDPDDSDHVVVSGYVNAGETATLTDCIVANPDPIWMTSYGTTGWWHWAPHPNLTFDVRAPSPGLIVTICYQPQGVCFTLPPRATVDGYEYAGCVTGPIYNADSTAVQPVAGSNGGYGVMTTVTFNVRNPTGKRLAKIGVLVDGGNDQLCTGTQTGSVSVDYWLQFFQP